VKKGMTSWAIWLVIFISIALILYYGGLGRYLTLESLQMKSRYLKSMVDQHYTSAVIVYCVTVMFLVALSLPVVAVFALLGGYLFGAVHGGLYVATAATLGGLGAFVVFRNAFANALKQKYSTKFERFNERITTYGVQYILILHYSMLMPFFVMNTLAALSNISLAKYIWITLLGLLPPCMVFAFAGRQFGQIATLRDAFSINVVMAMSLLILLALIPLIIRWFKGPVDV
jgi:uncharacterized membrane protein YdjX (TVP38/TMEM64 family)